MSLDLETIFSDAEFFGVPISQAQRFICRLIDGTLFENSEGLTPEEIEYWAQRMCGCSAAELPRARLTELLLIAGIRTGKSRLIAACAVLAALTVDCSNLKPGEVPRFSMGAAPMERRKHATI